MLRRVLADVPVPEVAGELDEMRAKRCHPAAAPREVAPSRSKVSS
jgi:hypothetical protein